MSSVPCSSSIRFLYRSFSFIDVDTLRAVAVDCLLPHHGGASIQAVLIATPQMRSESGLTFQSKQSAVWPADHAVGAAAASQQERLATCQIPHNVCQSFSFILPYNAHVGEVAWDQVANSLQFNQRSNV